MFSLSSNLICQAFWELKLFYIVLTIGQLSRDSLYQVNTGGAGAALSVDQKEYQDREGGREAKGAARAKGKKRQARSSDYPGKYQIPH